MHARVLVVGAGPVGLLAALLLGQRGASVTIYERWPSFYPLPRACTIDHEAIRILQDAGLADVRIHDLRHTFASLLVSGGASLEMIGKLLGHSQMQTTQRYAHLMDSPLR